MHSGYCKIKNRGCIRTHARLWSVDEAAGHAAARFALSPTRPGGATVRQGCGTVPETELHDREEFSGQLREKGQLYTDDECSLLCMVSTNRMRQIE
jgi:hypothetical protein